jgi:hypothetical protein
MSESFFFRFAEQQFNIMYYRVIGRSIGLMWAIGEQKILKTPHSAHPN